MSTQIAKHARHTCPSMLTSIVRFSKESAGMFDLDADLKIWVRGQEAPIVKQFKQDQHVNDVYRLLSAALLA